MILEAPGKPRSTWSHSTAIVTWDDPNDPSAETYQVLRSSWSRAAWSEWQPVVVSDTCRAQVRPSGVLFRFSVAAVDAAGRRSSLSFPSDPLMVPIDNMPRDPAAPEGFTGQSEALVRHSPVELQALACELHNTVTAVLDRQDKALSLLRSLATALERHEAGGTEIAETRAIVDIAARCHAEAEALLGGEARDEAILVLPRKGARLRDDMVRIVHEATKRLQCLIDDATGLLITEAQSVSARASARGPRPDVGVPSDRRGHASQQKVDHG